MDVTKRVPGRKLIADENVSVKQVLDHNLQWKQLQKRLDVLQVCISYYQSNLKCKLSFNICYNFNRIILTKK